MAQLEFRLTLRLQPSILVIIPQGLTTNFWCKLLINWAIGLMSRVFANGPGDWGSIPGHNKDSKNGNNMPPCLTLSSIR